MQPQKAVTKAEAEYLCLCIHCHSVKNKEIPLPLRPLISLFHFKMGHTFLKNTAVTFVESVSVSRV